MSIMVCMEYPLTFFIASCDHTTTFLGTFLSSFPSFSPHFPHYCSLFTFFLLSFSPPFSFSFALFIVIIICTCFTFTPHLFHVCFYLQIGPCCHYFVLTSLSVSTCKLHPTIIIDYL